MARKEAQRLRRRIDTGTDPLAERSAAWSAPTMDDLCEAYIAEHLPKKRPTSQANDRATIEKVIRLRLGRLKVENITHTDLEALHRQKSRSAPYQANREIALLSKMFSIARKKGWRSDNPAIGIERNPEHPRERHLSISEIERLTSALDDYPDQTVANALRMLMLTGARKSEVLMATWEQLDLEVGIWTKPGAMTKQRTEHRVPLSAPAIQVLAELRERTSGTYVFPGRIPGHPLKDIKRAWRTICEAADLQYVRVHDLRHTYASILASRGLSLPIIGRQLQRQQGP